MDLVKPTLATISLLNPNHLLESFGMTGLVLIIFLESCFAPLPGDSLLFTAGLLASHHKWGLNIWTIVISCTIAALLGNQVGYIFGRKVGGALYQRPNSKVFKQEHLERTHEYFERFGPKTVMLARFIPVVRGLTPIVAGVGRMNYRLFAAYNIVGGLLWVVGMTVGGWFLGTRIPNVDHYLLPIVALIIAVSFIPVAVGFLSHRNARLKNDSAGEGPGK